MRLWQLINKTVARIVEPDFSPVNHCGVHVLSFVNVPQGGVDSHTLAVAYYFAVLRCEVVHFVAPVQLVTRLLTR